MTVTTTDPAEDPRPRRLIVLSILAGALALGAGPGCATTARISVTAVPLSRPETNHALRINIGGHAETRVALEELTAADHTVALRVAVQHPDAGWGWFVGESERGAYLVGKRESGGWIHVNIGGQVLEADARLGPDRWSHLAVTVGARRLRLYVDGQLRAEAPLAGSPTVPRGRLRLGRRADRFAAEELVGVIDDVWILEGALPPEAVAVLAAGGAPPADVPAFAAFTFEPGGVLPELVGDAAVVSAPLTEPPPPVDPNHVTRLDLPFEGEWLVIQGYQGAVSHHGYAAFALDFIPADAPTDSATGARLEDFPCFGRPVHAPAAGRVVRLANDFADMPPGTPGRHGNFVILEHGPREFSELVHLQTGSIPLSVGDRVERGQLVGRCGNSGNAGTPHLHFAFLSSVEPIATRPARIAGFEVRSPDGGWTRAADDVPRAGEVVRRPLDATASVPRGQR